jgi:hypothetical protein
MPDSQINIIEIPMAPNKSGFTRPTLSSIKRMKIRSRAGQHESFPPSSLIDHTCERSNNVIYSSYQ